MSMIWLSAAIDNFIYSWRAADERPAIRILVCQQQIRSLMFAHRRCCTSKIIEVPMSRLFDRASRISKIGTEKIKNYSITHRVARCRPTTVEGSLCGTHVHVRKQGVVPILFQTFNSLYALVLMLALSCTFAPLFTCMEAYNHWYVWRRSDNGNYWNEICDLLKWDSVCRFATWHALVLDWNLGIINEIDTSVVATWSIVY